MAGVEKPEVILCFGRLLSVMEALIRSERIFGSGMKLIMMVMAVRIIRTRIVIATRIRIRTEVNMPI